MKTNLFLISVKTSFSTFVLCIFAAYFFSCSSGNEDPQPDLPQININDVEVNEGQAAKFTISLSKRSDDTVKVSVLTEDKTATAGDDYKELSAPSVLTFNPGDSLKTFSVTTYTDSEEEDAEEFLLKLTDAVNASIAVSAGTGTIINKEVPPSYYMEAKINGKTWKAYSNGLFGAELNMNVQTLAGYGTDADSQLSFVFDENIAVKTYGVDDNPLPSDNDKVYVTYTPDFFSGGVINSTILVGQDGGELVIKTLDMTKKTTSGTFEFTGKDDDGNTVTVTEGKFFLPVVE